MKWLRKIKENFFTLKPGINLHDIEFSVFPFILSDNTGYYLCYQLKATDRHELARAVMKKKENNRGIYFFSIPVSHQSDNRLVKRNLTADGFETYAKNDAVFWWNSDGSYEKLEIRETMPAAG